MKNLKKILNLLLIITAIFSTLVFARVETFAKTDLQAKQDLKLESRLGLLTQQQKVNNALLATAIPQVMPKQETTTNTVAPAPSAPTTSQTPQTQSKPQNIPQKNAYKITHLPQHSLKASLFKFIVAMLCVLISSLTILMGLKFYKKLGLKNKSKADNINYNKSLDSPKDLKEAINLFLEKTDK